MRAALLQAYASAAGRRDRARRRRARPSWPSRVAPVVPLDLLCASGTSYLGAAGAAVRARGPGRRPGRAVAGAGGRDAGVVRDDAPGWLRGTAAWPRPARWPRTTWCPSDAAVADEDAAAIGTSGIAAWMCLTWRAGLQPGERVLVLGAGGAVGQAAIAAARSLGAARVVAVCRSAAAERGRASRGGRGGAARGADDGDPVSLGQRFVGRRRRPGGRGGRPGVRAAGERGVPRAGLGRPAGQPRRPRW